MKANKSALDKLVQIYGSKGVKVPLSMKNPTNSNKNEEVK